MLDRPSDEDVSRQILGVFMRHRIPASGTLQRNNFFDVRDGDFQRGINKAVANNWITIDLRNPAPAGVIRPFIKARSCRPGRFMAAGPPTALVAESVTAQSPRPHQLLLWRGGHRKP
jgi:hypothetical protein